MFRTCQLARQASNSGIARQHSQFGRMHHRFQRQQKPYLLICFAVITFLSAFVFPLDRNKTRKATSPRAILRVPAVCDGPQAVIHVIYNKLRRLVWRMLKPCSRRTEGDSAKPSFRAAIEVYMASWTFCMVLP